MPYADNQGTRIHFRIEGKGPPLVLQHASLSTLNNWYDFGYVAALRDRYQLVMLDARGHGDSDKPHDPAAYHLKYRVADIVAVLDQLGLDKAHFFGYSMGGWIGFGIGQYAPERFYSLVIGGQHPNAQSMEPIRELVRFGIEHGTEDFIAAWEQAEGALSPGCISDWGQRSGIMADILRQEMPHETEARRAEAGPTGSSRGADR